MSNDHDRHDRAESSSRSISDDDIKEALNRSGYLLENRVESILRSEGFDAEPNFAYSDPYTSKSRELDLRAEAKLKAPYGTLRAELFIECANNTSPVAFITRDPTNVSREVSLGVKLFGWPRKLATTAARDKWPLLKDAIGLHEYHHYGRTKTSSQFCTFAEKKDGRGRHRWMADYTEELFSCLHALTSSAQQSYLEEHENIRRSGKKGAFDLNLVYLIFVLRGDLREVRETKEGLSIEAIDHVCVRRIHAYLNGDVENFLVDVVSENALGRLLKTIRGELAETDSRLSRQRDLVASSADVLIDFAKNNEKSLYWELVSYVADDDE
jgi:hypothetical protein